MSAAGAANTKCRPRDPSIGLIAGIAGAVRALGASPAEVKLVVHGTTIATNAVLERRFR